MKLIPCEKPAKGVDKFGSVITVKNHSFQMWMDYRPEGAGQIYEHDETADRWFMLIEEKDQLQGEIGGIETRIHTHFCRCCDAFFVCDKVKCKDSREVVCADCKGNGLS